MENQIITKIENYIQKNNLNDKLGLASIKTISFLAQGEYNRNFLITDELDKRVVFRINYGSQIGVEKQARYEYNALKILAASEHTPKPLFLDDQRNYFDHDILIEEFLPGEPLVYHRDLKKAAEILASIHRLKLSADDYDKLKVEKDPRVDRLEESNKLLEPVIGTTKLPSEQVKNLLLLKDWCEEHVGDKYFEDRPMCLVNTEINSNNFLITDDYGYLIDWEKPVISNAVQDLSQFMLETTTLWRTTETLDAQQVQEFIQRYSELTDRPYDEIASDIQVYMPYMLLRALSWCAMLVATYDDKPIQNVEILHRCQEYMEPSFVLPLFKKYGVMI